MIDPAAEKTEGLVDHEDSQAVVAVASLTVLWPRSSFDTKVLLWESEIPRNQTSVGGQWVT